MYLLDTNVISEIRKIAKGKANLGLSQWFQTVRLDDLYINTIVLLEQKKWVLSKIHRQDMAQAELLQEWLNYIVQIFDGRILPISQEVAFQCAELHVPNPRPELDSLIAATALTHNLILVTRNTKDFNHIDNLRLLNPFD